MTLHGQLLYLWLCPLPADAPGCCTSQALSAYTGGDEEVKQSLMNMLLGLSDKVGVGSSSLLGGLVLADCRVWKSRLGRSVWCRHVPYVH